MSAVAFGVDQRGVALLEDPIANKDTAFDAGERQALGLDGLLPPAVETLQQQALRAYEASPAMATIWPGISTCARCKTRTRFSSIDSCSTTSKR